MLLVLAAKIGCKLENLAVVGQYQGENHQQDRHGEFGFQNVWIIVHMLIVHIKDTAVD